MIALIPLFYFIIGRTTRHFFWTGYWVGLIWTLGTLYWIGWATVIGLVGTLIYVPVYMGIFVFLSGQMIKIWDLKSLWLSPVLWTGLEYMQSLGELGFPWNQMANTQTHMQPFIQFASFSGSYGISFWVILMNVLLFRLMRNFGKNRQTLYCLAAIVLAVGLPALHGMISIPSGKPEYPSMRVALIQGNIDPYKKWTSTFLDSNFTVYRSLTEKSNIANQLIVWPETATPCYLRYRYQYRSQVEAIAKSAGCPILTGSPDVDWNDTDREETFNAALLIQPRSHELQSYYKLKLVPFSERVPFMDKFEFFYKWLCDLHLDVGSYAPGDSIRNFHLRTESGDVFFGTAICFDSIFPFHVREYVRKGANFLTIITNDGWFGKTSGPYQHAQIAVLRAIENRRWIIRCANTGISGYIDPWGRYVQRSSIYKEAVMQQAIQLRSDCTFFVKQGHWFHRILLVLNALILIFLSIATVRKKNRNTV